MENREKKFKIKLTEKQKKIFMACLLFAGVAAVGCANFILTSQDASAPVSDTAKSETQDVFAAFREEKIASREEQLSYIDSVMKSAAEGDEVKKQAQQQKLELAANMEQETAAEGMIKTTLEADAVVTVSSSGVSVVIDKKTLTDAQAAQIAQIVTAQTGKSANNIKIIPQQKTENVETKVDE